MAIRHPVETSEFRQSGKASGGGDLGPRAGVGKLPVKGQTDCLRPRQPQCAHTRSICGSIGNRPQTKQTGMACSSAIGLRTLTCELPVISTCHETEVCF